MKATLHPKPMAAASAPANEDKPSSFREDIRALLMPEKKWHYLFHLVVVLVALSYWILSLIKHPDASWAELAMYRPTGDNQVFPTITALSKGNFGDPTDVVNYGQGVAAVQVVILLPHVVAYALFGPAGYMIMDAVLYWLYFVGCALLLRRCRFGPLASLVVASALATGSLQQCCWMLSNMVNKPTALFNLLLDEWHFPPLLDLPIFANRIPRPMITETVLVFLLYVLVEHWKCRRLSFKGGVVVGALLALLVQGDPYSSFAIGLLLSAVLLKTMVAENWKLPWRFVLGAALGGLICGAFFLFQLTNQNPEIAGRIGMAHFSRLKPLFLPGYASVLRVGVVAVLAGIVVAASRQLRAVSPGLGHGATAKEQRLFSRTEVARTWRARLVKLLRPSHPGAIPVEQPIATFCLVFVVASWLAQPAQIFVLGKGVQLYHYLAYVLPTLYAYALVILGFHIVRLAVQPIVQEGREKPGQHLPWLRTLMLALVLCLEVSLGIQESIEGVMSSGTARRENSPWQIFGARYRPAFRELEKQFRNDERLQNARSFATFSHEINFFLAGFYEKRAYLPDNAYSLLSDAELERRFCEMCKICGLHPREFEEFIQLPHPMNFWLGCAKYWYSPEHTYSAKTDYTSEQQAQLQKRPKQAPFFLAMPISEKNRLVKKYTATLSQNSDVGLYPDVIVTTALLRNQGISPEPKIYQEIYTNEVFSIHRKMTGVGVLQRTF